jgi:hypothetical protein
VEDLHHLFIASHQGSYVDFSYDHPHLFPLHLDLGLIDSWTGDQMLILIEQFEEVIEKYLLLKLSLLESERNDFANLSDVLFAEV